MGTCVGSATSSQVKVQTGARPSPRTLLGHARRRGARRDLKNSPQPALRIDLEAALQAAQAAALGLIWTHVNKEFYSWL